MTSEYFTTTKEFETTPTVITMTTTTQPTIPPTLCVPGFTDWFNIDSPLDTGSDIETIENIRVYYGFCRFPQSIECTDVLTDLPYTQTGENVTCNLEVGLKCLGQDQYDGQCRDYKVRFDCGSCGVTTTPVTEVISTQTISVTTSTISTSTKEEELTTPEISTEKTTLATTPEISTEKTTLATTPEISTEKTTLATTTEMATLGTLKPECSFHGWGPWMSVSYPTLESGGEYETFPNLRKYHQFCEQPVDIQCRARFLSRNITVPYEDARQRGVTCDINHGLVCINRQQRPSPICYDYEVRVYCICEAPPTTPVTTTETVMTTTTITQTTTVTKVITTSPVTTPPTNVTVTVPETTTSAVKEENYTTSMPTGLPETTTIEQTTLITEKPTTVSTGQPNVTVTVPETTTSAVKEENYTTSMPTGLAETTVTEQTTIITEKTTEKPTTVSTGQPNVTVTVPETTTSAVKEENYTTSMPTGLPETTVTEQISTEKTTIVSTGQPNVTVTVPETTTSAVKEENYTTSMPTGLPETTATEQISTEKTTPVIISTTGETTTQPKTETVPTTTTPFVPTCTKDGWSDWMSVDTPTTGGNHGDIEDFVSLRFGYQFCRDDEIKNISCRVKETGEDSSVVSQDVICNVEDGLVCMNNRQRPGQQCLDYEISVYCLCAFTSTITTPTGTTPTATTTSPGPTTPITTTEELTTVSTTVSPTGISTVKTITPEGTTIFETTTPSGTTTSRTTTPGGPTTYTRITTTEGVTTQKTTTEGVTTITTITPEGTVTRTTTTPEGNVTEIVTGTEGTITPTMGVTTIQTTATPMTTAVPTTVYTPTQPIECVSGWTDWMNSDNPLTGSGDNELISQLRTKYSFCADDQIINANCRVASVPYTDSSLTGQTFEVPCGINGLYCRNDANNPRCYNYEVRFQCSCPTTSPVSTVIPTTRITPTGSPSPTSPVISTVTPICDPGEVYVVNAFHCDQLCESMQQIMPECQDSNANISACLNDTLMPPEGFCKNHNNSKVMRVNNVWICVTSASCLCLREDTHQMVAPGSRWDENECRQCVCFDDKITCVNKTTPECLPTTTPSTVTMATNATTKSPTTVVTTPTFVPPTTTPVLEVCEAITNSSRCPDSCPVGQQCDGKKCVDSVDCPCLYEGSLYTSHFINDRCEACSCFNGTVIGCSRHCEIQQCPDGEHIVHPDGECCRCECQCRSDEFHCYLSGDYDCNHQCVAKPFQCDGHPDCPLGEDEMNCPTTTPPPPSCEGPNGEEIPAGQTVSVGPCKVCSCNYDGELTCNTTACPKTCKMYYNAFQTFDNQEYTYEICDHILAMNKPPYNTQFEVRVKKNCTRIEGEEEPSSICDKRLEFSIHQLKIVLRKNYVIHINNQLVRVSQLQQVSSVLMSNAGVSISKIGEEIVIRTNFSLFIYWSSMAESRIQVGVQLVDMVQGMCGIPNDNIQDDFTKPNGSIADDEQEFGDSWGSQEDCEEKNCLAKYPHFAQSAQQQCQVLRSDKFSACHGVVDVEYYIGLCEQHVCECLDDGLEDECVCDALTLYVKECANSDQHIVIDWRTPQFCAPPQCDHPMVWQDCATTCEWTCSAVGQPVSDCETECTTGCTCPSGMVKAGDTCIEIDDCQECYCYGFGDPHYVTFDGQYYPFQGNCSYVAARDTSPSQDFEVLVYNEECVFAPPTTCTAKVTIRYHGDEVTLLRQQKVIANGVLHQLPPRITVGGIQVELMGSWILYAKVPEINLIVTFDDFNDGFSISIPSNKYFNKTEGLCGVCNYDPRDDMTKKDGQLTDNSDEFAFSWLNGEDNQTCVSVAPQCAVDNMDRAVRECQQALYSGVLQQCNVIVDPELFYRSCLLDNACKGNACDIYASYAKECSRQGLCIDWRNDECPPPVCEGGKIFEPCHKGCRENCENHGFYNIMMCDKPDSEGCFCPPGSMENDTGHCVPSCERCVGDNGMIYEVGQEWQDGPCQHHTCQPGGVIQTNITECPQQPNCQSPKVLVTHQDPNMCCPTYTCECDTSNCPVPTTGPVFGCNDDQELMNITINECCTRQECVCRPCSIDPVPTCLPYETVEMFKENPEDCCDQYQCVCNTANCPPNNLQCPPNMVVEQTLESLGACCPEYECICNCPEVNDIVCPTGYEKEESLSDDECECQQLRCVPKEVCLWNNTLTNELEEVQPGTLGLQGSDPCKTCECLEEKDPNSEFYTIMCTVQTCPVLPDNCPQDSEYIAPAAGTCCGECKQKWCVDEMGIRHEMNETWTPIGASNPCDYSECRLDSDGVLRIFPFMVTCPPIAPANCPSPDYELKNDSSGCCEYCAVSPMRNCRLVEKEVVLEVNGCISAEKVELPYCEGRCSSSSMYSTETNSIDVDCNCCQATSSQRKDVTLVCSDNSTMTYQYDYIAGCDCDKGCHSDVVL